MKFLRSLTFFSLLFSLLISGVSPARAEVVQEQRNERQMIVLWKENQVFGSGYHRPYSQLVLRDENEDTLWEGKSDARGYFTFLLDQGAVDPAYQHTLTVSASDQFGRQVVQEDGSVDIIRAILLPGLATEGVTHPNAEIMLIDTDGKLLNTFTADENGNYTVFNAPEGSTLRIETNGETVETGFSEGTMKPVYIDGIAPDTENTSENNTSDSPINDEPDSPENSFGMTLLIIVLLGLLGVGGFLFFRKKQE